MTALPPAVPGAVYDRGYRPYEGQRGGRREAAMAVWRLSVRRAVGLRRSWRQKVFPWTLLAIATVPAVVWVGVGYVARENPLDFTDFEFISYREYVGVSTSLLLFVALAAPDIVCPDRQQRVLPLLFSRPLTGMDYVLAKLGAMAFVVFGFGFLPHVVLFVGQMFVTQDGALNYLTDNADVLWKVPISVALLALYYAALGVGLSSLTDRRIVAGTAILGSVLVTHAIAGIVEDSAGPEGSALAVVSLLTVPLHLRDLVFLGHLTRDTGMAEVTGGPVLAITVYLAVVGSCLAVLVHRYRQVDL